MHRCGDDDNQGSDNASDDDLVDLAHMWVLAQAWLHRAEEALCEEEIHNDDYHAAQKEKHSGSNLKVRVIRLCCPGNTHRDSDKPGRTKDKEWHVKYELAAALFVALEHGHVYSGTHTEEYEKETAGDNIASIHSGYSADRGVRREIWRRGGTCLITIIISICVDSV